MLKRKARLIGVIIIVLTMLISGCSLPSTSQNAEPILQAPKPPSIQVEPQVDREKEQQILSTMQNSMRDVGRVSLIDDIFVFIPIEPGFIVAIKAAEDGHSASMSAWRGLVSTMQELSITIDDVLPGYYLALQNPTNVENTILVVQNGTVLYNALK